MAGANPILARERRLGSGGPAAGGKPVESLSEAAESALQPGGRKAMIRFGFLAALGIALAGCAGLQPDACAPGQQAMLTAELLFGRKIGDRIGVGEAAFRRFVDEEVTPRFPDGLTIIDASGQYRDTRRAMLVREPSKLVLIALKDEPEGRARLAAIAGHYKARFNQQSVGTILRPACVSF